MSRDMLFALVGVACGWFGCWMTGRLEWKHRDFKCQTCGGSVDTFARQMAAACCVGCFRKILEMGGVDPDGPETPKEGGGT